MSSVPDQSVSSGKLNQDSLSIHHSRRANSGMEASGRRDTVDWLRERGLGVGAERSHLQGLSALHAQVQDSGIMHQGMHDAGAEQVGVQGLGAKQIEAQGLGAASTFVSSAPRSLSDMNHSTNEPGRGLSGAHSGCPGSQAANVHGAAHLGIGFISSGTPQGVGLAAQAPTMFADPVAPGHSSVGSPLNPADPPSEGRDATWFGNTATPRGRGEFEPGDRVFWELPKLGCVSEPNAAVRASDWLYRSALMLRDLSSKSWQWWDRVYEAALRHYHDYQQADPLSRGLLRADLPEDLRHHTFARLEPRAVSMILHAVPESIASQALATRSLSTVGLLFQILKQYQPGGLGERQELLRSLTDLSPASHAGDAVLVLQAWFRHVARARTMQVQLPDGSLLLAALDTMAKPLLADNSQLAFRVSLNRHQLRLDYRAELELVEAYARNLMAEFELLSLASDSPSSPKKPRVRKAKEKASAPVPPPKESAAAPIPPASSPLPPKPPPAKAPMSSKACTSWLTDVGCKYGSKCRFVHNMETEALKGRCFACSAKDHWANNCPVKQAERQGDSPPGKAKGHSARKGEGKGKASVGLKALDSGLPSVVETPGVGSTESSAPNHKTMILETENPATELAREVTEVLRSLRLKKLGYVRSKSKEYRIQSMPEPQAVLSYGLVDSGATTAVRTGHSHELQEALPVTVQLAVGEATMSANKYGTLLSPDQIQPIIPMSSLAALGCVISWTDVGVSIRHPSRGLLPVRLHNKCPEIPHQLTLELIEEYECLLQQKHQSRSQAKSAVAAALGAPLLFAEDPLAWIKYKILQEGLTLSLQAQWLHMLFPELPQHVLERVVCPVGFNVNRVPYNRHTRRRLFSSKVPTLLHLFSGVQQWRDCGHVLHVEKEKGGDLLSNDIFGMVLEAVLAGGVEGCVAGPPCNTSSACRMAADGGPRQVRARDGPERYGVSSNTSQEQAKVDDATVLWFRTFLVFLLIKAIKGPRAFLGLEHPQDPSEWSDAQSPLQACPSIWSFHEVARLRQLLQAWVAKFDQGCFSHPRRKPTSFLTTNWVIYEHLDGHRCPAHWKPQVDERSFVGPSSLSLASQSKYPSASWARWSPGFVHAVKHGWRHHCQSNVQKQEEYAASQQVKLQALSPSWQAHVAADHHPYRKDCEICLQAASRDRPHFRQTDRSFYSLSADISGPFVPGKDVGGPKRYFVAFAIRLPVGDDFPWTKRQDPPQVFPAGFAEPPTPRTGVPLPVSGPSTRVHNPTPCVVAPVPEEVVPMDLGEDVQADSISPPVKIGPHHPSRRVRGKSSPTVPDPVPDMSEAVVDQEMQFSRDGAPDLSLEHALPAYPAAALPPSAPADRSALDFMHEPDSPGGSQSDPALLSRAFVTLRWAEPLKSRSADHLRLVIMQSIARCKAYGVPVLRFHSDRAKEFQSSKLSRWLAEQAIHSTKSAPEDPQANGAAESAVKEVKRTARRSLLSSGLSSSHWPLAVRQASEILWRSALSHLGCPTRPLLAFGTKVQARSREWLKRSDKQWGQRTLPGHLVGPAPQTPSAYVVLLQDGQLYISSSVHPVTAVSGSLSSSEALPSCEVQLKLFQASGQGSSFDLPDFPGLLPESAFQDSSAAVRVLRAAPPCGGGDPQSLPLPAASLSNANVDLNDQDGHRSFPPVGGESSAFSARSPTGSSCTKAQGAQVESGPNHRASVVVSFKELLCAEGPRVPVSAPSVPEPPRFGFGFGFEGTRGGGRVQVRVRVRVRAHAGAPGAPKPPRFGFGFGFEGTKGGGRVQVPGSGSGSCRTGSGSGSGSGLGSGQVRVRGSGGQREGGVRVWARRILGNLEGGTQVRVEIEVRA